MRGSTPLDVAAASVMDNNELALALREPDLEKVRVAFAHTYIYISKHLYSSFYNTVGNQHYPSIGTTVGL